MRIKFEKSSWLVKIIVAIVFVYALVTLVYLQRQITEKQREREALEIEITETQQENANLKENIDMLDTDEGKKAVAREKLGLVSEGEVTFYDIGN